MSGDSNNCAVVLCMLDLWCVMPSSADCLVQVSCLQQSEPGVVMFKLDCGLQFRVSINPATMQSLRLKVSSLQTTGK